MKMFSAPTRSRISMLAPSSVPMVSAPFSASFMLPVPEASMPGGRDLLGQVGRRDDRLGEAHVVVRQEDDLEQAAHRRVVVDDPRDVVGELDDELGLLVAGGGLAGEDLHARHPVARRARARIAS